MPASRPLVDRVAQLALTQGVLRTRDLEAKGISRATLGRLVEEGLLERVARGVYGLPDADVTEHHTLVEAGLRVPAGVICLLSALEFHQLSTQSPHEVWIAIGVKARKPTLDWPPIRIVRFSGAALTHGIETHTIEGAEVRITGPAKTVADCFKYRNKIGLDVAIEALSEYRRKRGSIDILMKAAAADRVARVLRPYIEAVA
ncbi:type IV toxin-antitoxin system AbiEi family antitoxin domain-containing protein [Chondromyces apiculatus]|uniref:AbiEi antitoxin N-terminal domain-containing protein n=1 Tax=Chondromyces apiculatus DSM 436 TaxID=1192034 RepID=A0A017STU6_9BACT|nr:AbiEi antitoxin N-terminal domain-containing protein [Chondromyces apiculatus]EYF00389.1 Hypothetical protein CAP_0873 [Chondromyces apiculatus DSM 436]